MDFVVVVTGYITLLTPEGDAGGGGGAGKTGSPNLRILRCEIVKTGFPWGGGCHTGNSKTPGVAKGVGGSDHANICLWIR